MESTTNGWAIEEQKLEMLSERFCPQPIQTPNSSTGSGDADLLRVFRGEHSRIALRLHPLEKNVVTTVGLRLSFLPWALGTMHVWSQIVSFVFSNAPRPMPGQLRYFAIPPVDPIQTS
ncbi:MAG: hypothetical protein H7343_08165 [Undibacterium sp.]|nr:hypothetical protein [Opitutaceae bacterium]